MNKICHRGYLWSQWAHLVVLEDLSNTLIITFLCEFLHLCNNRQVDLILSHLYPFLPPHSFLPSSFLPPSPLLPPSLGEDSKNGDSDRKLDGSLLSMPQLISSPVSAKLRGKLNLCVLTEFNMSYFLNIKKIIHSVLIICW